jgi:HPt (histidine-containing phosphotransfer) domain-containing protein
MSHTTDPREPETSAIVEASSQIEVLDSKVFHDLLESLADPVVVAGLYRKFVGNAAAFICELRVQEDVARLDTLHTLKGSAAMMGAKRMAALALQLQTQWHSSPVQVAQAIEQLEAELVKFRSAASAKLREVGASPGFAE